MAAPCPLSNCCEPPCSQAFCVYGCPRTAHCPASAIPYVDWQITTRPGGVTVASGNTGTTGCATVSLPDGDYTLCGQYNPPGTPPIPVPGAGVFADGCRDFTVACPVSDIRLSLDPAPGYHCGLCTFPHPDTLTLNSHLDGTLTLTWSDTAYVGYPSDLACGPGEIPPPTYGGWVSDCVQRSASSGVASLDAYGGCTTPLGAGSYPVFYTLFPFYNGTIPTFILPHVICPPSAGIDFSCYYVLVQHFQSCGGCPGTPAPGSCPGPWYGPPFPYTCWHTCSSVVCTDRGVPGGLHFLGARKPPFDGGVCDPLYLKWQAGALILAEVTE